MRKSSADLAAALRAIKMIAIFTPAPGRSLVSILMTIKALALLTALLALAGCATAPTSASPNGSSTTIDGIDLWNGTPPRPYRVISTVSHEGPDLSATYADEEALIAQDAQKAGADGAIIVDTVMVPSRISLVDSRPVMAPKVDAQLIKYQ
jgi:hypothetical protein